jgi:2,3-bisphosphoglycerate-dependent phosphoglycerate mutase
VTRVVLIRHAQIRVDPESSSDAWQLSPEGELAAERLTIHPSVRGVACIYTSPEPKAVATAQAIAGGREVRVCAGLRELDRGALGWIGSPEEYRETVRQILRNPDESVRGCESAARALRRVLQAIALIRSDHEEESVAVVSHGIVLTLYLSSVLERDPDIALWESIDFPDVAVVDLDGPRVIQDFGARGHLLS